MSTSNSDFLPVSDEELADLDTPSPRKSKSKIDTSIRTVETWFRIPTGSSGTHFGFCENPDCEDQRPRKVAEGNAIVAEINGTTMCRLCFVKGYKL